MRGSAPARGAGTAGCVAASTFTTTLASSESKRAEQGRTEAFPGAGFSLPPLRQAGGSSGTCSCFLLPWLAALSCVSRANEGERGRFPSSVWVLCIEQGQKEAEERGVPGSPRPPPRGLRSSQNLPMSQ